MNHTPLQKTDLESKDIPTLLEMLTDSKRIANAKRITTQDIRIVYLSDDAYMYEIKGTKHNYFLKIDWKHKVLVHNCEDWLHRGMRDYQLCKHFVRIFQLVYEKEAKKILIDLILQPWRFADSEDYLR
ncbi:MAG: hypothetical protein ACTSRC_17195 [Candidatus Helarchaeota archaeon]